MQAQPSELRSEERNWGMLSHLLSLLGYVVIFGHCVPPLIIYLTKRGESDFVAGEARESLNFQLTLLVVFLLSLPLICLVFPIPLLLLLWVVMGVAQFVLPIVAAIKASDGVPFRYPLILRLVS